MDLIACHPVEAGARPGAWSRPARAYSAPMAPDSRLAVPVAAALVAVPGRAAIVGADGECLLLAPAEAAAWLAEAPPPLLVHAPATFRRLGMRPLPALDLLELFAFVHPARPAPPSPRGLARVLAIAGPADLLAQAAGLGVIAAHLLDDLMALPGRGRAVPAALARRMGEAGWLWAPFVRAALGPAETGRTMAEAFAIWRRMPAWEESAPPPPPRQHPVLPAEARRRLAALLGPEAEERPGQADFASAAAAAFVAPEAAGEPAFVLAEAGTGTGKTLGYIAPASLWAERNRAPVTIATFTRHLQRQIEGELARLFPDPAERRRRVVLRKGRENYLCLLNYEDSVGHASRGAGAIPLGLLARWAEASADGDILGGDLPGWFADLFGARYTAGLADRRGECIHAACPHWRRCVIEHGIRRARDADLVIANHALVMAQAAWGGLDDNFVPTRYVFDEGHHLFEAADGAFAVELSGRAMAEMRRWLLGAEGGRGRARGLRLRLNDMITEAEEGVLAALLSAARALPDAGWAERLAGGTAELALAGPERAAERLLASLRAQVLARAEGEERMALEIDLFPLGPEVAERGAALARALERIAEPAAQLARKLAARITEESEEMESALRLRIEAGCRTLRRRVIEPLGAWREMLAALAAPPPAPGEVSPHVLFLRLERGEEGERDLAFLRHWLDPTLPFATAVVAPAHGVLVTSATLRDGGAADDAQAWEMAEARVGAPHLARPAIRAALPSPFDYARQTRAFVVTDVAAREIAPLAAAYRALFLAAGGGGLGLFTAIARLRAVHRLIAPALAEAGLALYAQHVDGMDNASLVDLFRAEPESCLLGTDAMRDGVDVPGMALRLVVFERVPWPRPDILHRERRLHLSGGDTKGYDEAIARLRLRQAFGRLIRRRDDRGVFVLLDRATPSRLLGAFPKGVVVQRLGLAEAVAETRAFLGA